MCAQGWCVATDPIADLQGEAAGSDLGEQMRRRSFWLLVFFLVAGLTFWSTLAGESDTPTLVAPTDGATGVLLPPTLHVTVADPDPDLLDVTFFGRPSDGPPPEDFTVVHMTDTQYYSQSNPATFQAITEWVRDNQEVRNIVFVTLSGDLVNIADQIVQWERADTAMSVFDEPIPPYLPEGIPYGVTPGNHDQTPNGNPDGTENYNLYFGIDRFVGRSYYGGNYGTDNDNNFALFSGAGMDFIVVHLEFDRNPDPAILAWADNLLQTHADHRAIVSSHYIMEIGEQAPFSVQGQAIYDALKHNPNLFLMLAGHMHGEGKRIDVYDENVVWTLLADYQDEPNQGNGWTRLLEFSPADDEIRVSTYSPTLDQFQTDADSQFTLDYEMDAGPPFVELGTVTGVPAGGSATLVWPDLEPNRTYEWYVEVSDAVTISTGPIWAFTTACSGDTECDDDNLCTLDSCNAGVCVHTDDDFAECDDGDACTIGDQCLAGNCAGEPVSCPDGFSCDPDSGLCMALPQTITLQQGTAGYGGTVDTYLNSSLPDADNSAADTLVVDRSPERHILLRFESLFVSEGGPIPDGAEILSARLTINVTNESPGVGASVHRMLQPWTETDSWNQWGSGIQADDSEAASQADASSSSGVGLHNFTVTPSLAAWAAGQANRGWAWLPPVADNSWRFDSAEGALPPKLEVTFQLACLYDFECDDANPCNGLESCVAGACAPGVPIDCGAQLCDPFDGSCVDCVTHADCGDGNICNGLEICDEVLRACLPGMPPDCGDSVACTDDSCDPQLGCINLDNCPAGELCLPATGVCESSPGLAAGDLIVAGFQPVGAAEFIELFNTTNREIALDDLQLIVRVDNDADGVVELDWQLNAYTTGMTIQPHGFFLIAEPTVVPGPADIEINMALPSQEGGITERAIGIQLLVGGAHMDHLLYGRHDGSSPAGEIPPGDISFVGFPGARTEVIRTLSGDSFGEGVTQRISSEELHAGSVVQGFYTDEESLPGDLPPGVWTSQHGAGGPYLARGSSFGVVLPPDCVPPDVGALIVEHADMTTLNWLPQATGTHFDVASGGLLELRADGGAHNAQCLANGLFDTEWSDPRPAPDAGEGFYYLVRAQTDCGSGSYGFESPAEERVVTACP